MLEQQFSLDVYQNNRCDKIREIALLLTSLIPLCLLFSRIAADIALSATGVLFVIYCIKTRNYAFIKQPINKILLFLWASFLIGALFAFYSKTSAFYASFVFIRYILFFFACTSWLFTTMQDIKFAGKIITVTLIIAAGDTLFQSIMGFSISGKESEYHSRLTSFMRRPNIGIYLAKLIFPIIGLWAGLALDSKNRNNLLLSGFFLLFVVCVIALTGERSATALTLLALIAMLFIIGVTYKKLRIYTASAVIGICSAFTLIVYNSSFIYSRLLDFIRDVGDFPSSLYGQLFQASILSWQEYGFFLGVGLRQFRYACPEFKEQGLVTYCDLHSHNMYLELLSESGIIGLGLFSIFVILCLGKVWKLAYNAYNKNMGEFISSIFIFGGLFTVLFPISVTMSFITNWSGVLNWMVISLCISMLNVLNHKYTEE